MMSMYIPKDMQERIINWRQYYAKKIQLLPDFLVDDLDEYAESIKEEKFDVDCWYSEVRTDINMLENDLLYDKEFCDEMRNFFLHRKRR